MIENKSMCSLSIFDVSNLFSIIKAHRVNTLLKIDTIYIT